MLAHTANMGGSTPQPPAVFQGGHHQRQQQETDQERPVRAELIGDAGGQERRTQRAIEALRPVKRHQPDDSAETGEQRRAEQHQPGEPPAGVDQVEDHFRQPLVGQVEIAHVLFARKSRLAHVSRIGERIGNRQLMVLPDVLAALEKPPGIRIGDFAGEPAHQRECGERQDEGPQPARRGRGRLLHNRRRAAGGDEGACQGLASMRRIRKRMARIAMPIKKHRHGQAPTAKILLAQRRLAGFERFLGNGHTGVDGFAHLAGIHGVQGQTGLHQVLAAVDQAHLRFGDFHPVLLGARQHGLGLFQRPIQAVDPRGHLRGGLGRGASRLVASGTNRIGANQHGRGGLMDGMVGMAHDAPPPPPPRENRLVNALFVQLFERHMARSAHRRHRFHVRRLGAMVAVARRATGRGKIAPLGHGFPMHAGAVLLKLVGGDFVGGHLLLVGVAARAGFGDVQRMDRGHAVLDRADVVDAVAVDAGGHVGIAGRQALAVNAGLVKLVLIDAFRRREFAHDVGIGVAARAEFRNGGSRRLAFEALGLAHGDAGIVARAVAAVAIRATQAVGDMDVVLDERGGTFGAFLHGGVAGHARVRGGPEGATSSDSNRRRKRMAGALI